MMFDVMVGCVVCGRDGVREGWCEGDVCVWWVMLCVWMKCV